MSGIIETDELQLVEKVELRLALADTAEKFEKNLNLYLTPLLLKLASPHNSVRKSVLESVKTINERLTLLTTIKLPVESLILQSKSLKLTTTTSTQQYINNVKLFSLLFASKGIERLSTMDEVKPLLPIIINGFHTAPLLVKSRLFYCLIKLLPNYKAPMEDTPEYNALIKYLKTQDAADFDELLDLFTKFFLLVPSTLATGQNTIPRGYSCPGLSVEDVEFFTYNAGVSFNRDQLNRFKVGIFNFVSSGFTADFKHLFKFLSIVSTDTNQDLAEKASQKIKRMKIPYEDEKFIDYVINLYTGNRELGIPPVKHELQEKILLILNNSVYATGNEKNVLLICSIGLNSTYYRVKSLTLLFIRHTAKINYRSLLPQQINGSDFQINITSLIRSNLHSEGWPKLQINSSSQTTNINNLILQRRLQYETLGDILKNDFKLVEDLSFIEFLFDALKGDLHEFRESIQSSLLGLLKHLPNLPESSLNKLRILLRKNLSDDFDLTDTNKDIIMIIRYVSIKYVNAAFEFNDPVARLFNIWGTSRNNRFDIVEESIKGLNPYWFKLNKSSLIVDKFVPTEKLLYSDITEVQFPSFQSLVELLLKDIENSTNNSSAAIHFSLHTAVRFAKQCLISTAIYQRGTVVVQDEIWSTRIEKAMEIDKNVRMMTSKLISTFDGDWYPSFLERICNEFTVKDIKKETISIASFTDPVFGETMISLLKVTDESTINGISTDLIPNLISFVHDIETTNDHDLLIAGSLIGILSTGAYHVQIQEVIDSLNDDIKFPYLFSAAFVLPRLVLCGKSSSYNLQEQQISRFIKNLIAQTKNLKRKKVILKLLGEVLKFGLVNSISPNERESIIRELFNIFESKLINDEPVTEVWGYLSLYSNEFGLQEKCYEALFKTNTSKQTEFLFTAGESLSVVVGGWNSQYLIDQIDLLSIAPDKIKMQFRNGNYDTDFVEKIWKSILEACDSTNPSVKKASCIWLLSLVKFLKSDNVVLKYANEIHLKFIKFLAVQDELVQESAASGLSLIYQIGNNDLKEEMLKTLLRSFTNTTKTMVLASGSIGNESEIFEPGMMSTGTDSSISTYGDIVNLASEVGDPALVYKFMNLAKSSTLWSSRKGIAFGLGAIVSKEALEKTLFKDEDTTKKLVSVLYRYRFDPYSTVARSMNDIWKTILPEPTSMVRKYSDAILEELLSGMSQKEWRVREASTSGLIQLIQTQPKELFLDRILEVWTMGFRVMDDIKESVREAGNKLTLSLSKSLTYSIDTVNNTDREKSSRVLDSILPLLLGTKGLESDVENVRNFALSTLSDLVKRNNAALKPYGPRLMYEFTLLFSSIEPQVINYLALNSNNYNIDSNAMDARRKAAVMGSPLFQTIEKLISSADDLDISEYIEYSIKAVKGSLGLPSKVMASFVITLIIKRFSVNLKPYSGKLLKTCLNMLDDRNETVNCAFASTFGHIYKVSTVEKNIKYSKKLVKKYFDASLAINKRIVGKAIEAVITYSPSEFNQISGIFIPLIFVASNDIDEDNCILYKKIWVESSSSDSSTVKLYLAEILDLIIKNIRSSDFNMRKMCAESISSICIKVDNTISEKQALMLVNVTIDALNGRSWDGKEILFEALVNSSVKFKKFIEQNANLSLTLKKAISTEIDRNNKQYVKSIISSYSKYLSNFGADENDSLNFIRIVENILGDVGRNNDTAVGSDTKRVKPNVEISEKSSKSNIEKEELVNKLLQLSVDIISSKDARSYSKDLLDFIVNNARRLFSNDAFIYTWRSQLNISDIGTSLLNKVSPSMRDDYLEKRTLELWDCAFENNIKKETIDSVKINLINFGSVIISKLPNLASHVKASLRELEAADITSRIQVELKNAGI